MLILTEEPLSLWRTIPWLLVWYVNRKGQGSWICDVWTDSCQVAGTILVPLRSRLLFPPTLPSSFLLSSSTQLLPAVCSLVDQFLVLPCLPVPVSSTPDSHHSAFLSILPTHTITCCLAAPTDLGSVFFSPSGPGGVRPGGCWADLFFSWILTKPRKRILFRVASVVDFLFVSASDHTFLLLSWPLPPVLPTPAPPFIALLPVGNFLKVEIMSHQECPSNNR